MVPGLWDAALTAVGLAVVLLGAWLLVRSAASLAVQFGLSPVIVGATVVAFGTSAPEFVVSLVAASDGSGGLAVGNVLGSNVTNVALVLGLSGIVRPMVVHPRLLRWEMPVLAAATAAILLVGSGGTIGHGAGAALFAGLLVFVALSLRLRPTEAAAADGGGLPAAGGGMGAGGGARGGAPGGAGRAGPGAGEVAGEVSLAVAGIAALAVGSEVAVHGAVGIAERVGVSEVAIGVTVVAIGTSLPEIVTSAVAALRGEHEIAVANVVGSNVFNLLGVLGLTGALITLPTGAELYRFEMPALAASTVVLFVLAWPRGRVGRPEGALLVVFYAAFVAIVLARGGA